MTRPRRSSKPPPGRRSTRRWEADADEARGLRHVVAALTLAFLLALFIIELAQPRAGPLTVLVLSIASIITLLALDLRRPRRLPVPGPSEAAAFRTT